MQVHLLIREIAKMLRNLDGCLDKAVAYGGARKFDPDVLLGARLAPDMFPLIRQIQTACDTAKFAAARVSGKDAPSHPDTEKTMAEAKQRIATVVSYLDGFSADDFAGADTRTISLPRWEGKSMTAVDYFIEHGLPNFFFHVTTAYAILRHNGVDVGKRDFLGAMSWR